MTSTYCFLSMLYKLCTAHSGTDFCCNALPAKVQSQMVKPHILTVNTHQKNVHDINRKDTVAAAICCPAHIIHLGCNSFISPKCYGVTPGHTCYNPLNFPKATREPYNWSLESSPINACIKYTWSCLFTIIFICLYGSKLRYQRHYKFSHNWFIFQTPIFGDQLLWAPYPLAPWQRLFVGQ